MSNIPVGEDYVFQLEFGNGVEFSSPLYLTGNGEGNQLTIRTIAENKNKQVD